MEMSNKTLKFLTSLFLIIFVFVLNLFVVPSASAGQLSTGGASVTWDDRSLILPKVCGSNYFFSFQTDGTLGQASLDLLNGYGNSLGYGLLSNSASGVGKISVCETATSPFVAPFSFQLTVYNLATSGGNGEKKIASVPITLLSQPAKSSSFQKCAKGKKVLNVPYGAKCPKGYVRKK
jgi:hypothetical protein